MNAEERREARRKRILNNSDSRLKKITRLTVTENVSNGNEQDEYVKDKHENNTLYHELPDWSVPKYETNNVSPTIIEDHQIFNYEPNLGSNTHSTNIKYQIKCSSITILHIILSQIVLVLFYYDLGYLFGNSIVVPFVISVIPELYMSKEPHNRIYVAVLLMLGLSQNLAERISKCAKLVSVIGKRFCIYVFCFTCSYAVLKYYS